MATETLSSVSEAGSGSPGAILRRCREFHGITLDEASEATKIGVSHLRALEDDQIREFANQAYLKGFLRIYASYLGLNSDDIARMYDKLSGAQGEKQDSVRAATVTARPRRRLITFKKLLLPAVLLVLIIITATFFKRPPPPLVRTLPVAVAVTPPLQYSSVRKSVSPKHNQINEQEIPSPIIEKTVADQPEAEASGALKRPADMGKGFILKIKVTQNGTLTATVDGFRAQQYEMTSGDVIEWKAEKKVMLELSNAGGVDVELNGKPYKSLGPLGKPVYVEFDADGVKQ